MGKFLFRFLLPPELGCCSSLRGTSQPLHTTGVHSNSHAPGPQLSSLAAGPSMQCRPSSVWWWAMGKYLVKLPPNPYRMSLRPSLAYSQVQGSQEVLGRDTSSPRAHKEHKGGSGLFLCPQSTPPRKPPGWRAWDCGWGAAPFVYPESWGRALMGDEDQAIIHSASVRWGNQKLAFWTFVSQADLGSSCWFAAAREHLGLSNCSDSQASQLGQDLCPRRQGGVGWDSLR